MYSIIVNDMAKIVSPNFNMSINIRNAASQLTLIYNNTYKLSTCLGETENSKKRPTYVSSLELDINYLKVADAIFVQAFLFLVNMSISF